MPRPKHELVDELDRAGDILDRVQMELAYPHRDPESWIVALDVEELAHRIRLLRWRLKRSGLKRRTHR